MFIGAKVKGPIRVVEVVGGVGLVDEIGRAGVLLTAHVDGLGTGTVVGANFFNIEGSDGSKTSGGLLIRVLVIERTSESVETAAAPTAVSVKEGSGLRSATSALVGTAGADLSVGNDIFGEKRRNYRRL